MFEVLMFAAGFVAVFVAVVALTVADRFRSAADAAPFKVEKSSPPPIDGTADIAAAYLYKVAESFEVVSVVDRRRLSAARRPSVNRKS